MDNEKDTPNTINDMMENTPTKPAKPIIFNQNDSIEVNNLISLMDSDITPDLLAQLEQRARAEQEKLETTQDNKDSTQEQAQETTAETEQNLLVQEDIQIPEGLPGEGGAVNITGEIMERPKPQEQEPPKHPVLPQETSDPLEEAKLNAIYKKYVIYINPNNEKYLDSLSLQERKELINKILYEQNEIAESERAEKLRIQRTIKLAIAIATFVITVPLAYFIFNVSLEATIQNYRHSKSNFEVLYKETGKIKINQ